MGDKDEIPFELKNDIKIAYDLYYYLKQLINFIVLKPNYIFNY